MNFKRVFFAPIIIGVIVAIAIVGYVLLTTKSHSPADKVVYQDDEFELIVDYSRPYKKGRLIFGNEAEGALVPYDEYWRTGANEATEIEFNRDIRFEGNDLKSGRYRLYSIPGDTGWVIAVNGDTGKWGYNEPDREKDVLRVNVKPGKSESFCEQFTISAKKLTDSSMVLSIHWDHTMVPVRIDY